MTKVFDPDNTTEAEELDMAKGYRDGLRGWRVPDIFSPAYEYGRKLARDDMRASNDDQIERVYLARRAGDEP
jgi:hypothetical protein